MRLPLLIHLLLILIAGCKKEYAESYILTPDWTDSTHSSNIAADYEEVFGEGVVKRFDITISGSDWTKMQSDLTSNIKITNPPSPINPNWVPLWVPCSFRYNGREWYKVGIRYKGNSSLRECLRRNIRKYSFKFDFDQFEVDYPAIRNQRFFGFRQLNLSNGFDDMSLMREKTADDLFREFGISSAHCSFVELWIDYGEGSKYFGLYTMIEEVEEDVVKTQFEEGGNLYKPEGPAATFAYGTYMLSQFYLQNNTGTADYSDVRALYETINSATRLSNPSVWKSELENVFDVPHFLKWLASNTVMVNWDTYGKMSHNYYLYNDPATGRLIWIPWDNNESLRPGKQGGGLSLGLTEVTNGWPLIRFLINDPAWLAQYKDNIGDFISDVFSASSITGRIDGQAQLIRPYAIAEQPGYTFLSGASSFDNGILEMKQHCQERITASVQFLSGK
jgi:spore coat protein CotH